jgi:hypothetical protein
LRNILVCLSRQSKRSFNRSLGSKDSPKASATFALRCWKGRSDSNGNWPVERLLSPSGLFFFKLWQGTSPGFSTYISLTICLQPAEMKWLQEKKPRYGPENYIDGFLQRYESDHSGCTAI